MFKNIMLVGFGSFFGGVVRYLVTRMLSVMVVSSYPFGTFAVNVLGCFIIGFVSALPVGSSLSPNTRLLLTTGLCGGFTTFSTFICTFSSYYNAKLSHLSTINLFFSTYFPLLLTIFACNGKSIRSEQLERKHHCC